MVCKKWILAALFTAFWSFSTFAGPADPADCGCAEDETVDPSCSADDCSTINPDCCIPLEGVPIGDPAAISSLMALGTGLAGFSIYRKRKNV